MTFLVDTHLVLWRMTDRPLSSAAKHAIGDDPRRIAVSAVSVWEVAVKWSIRKGRLDDMPISGTDFLGELRQAGIAPMPVTADHSIILDDLPLLHRDPFDRLLIAQARSEGMQLLTSDAELAAYGSDIIRI